MFVNMRQLMYLLPVCCHCAFAGEWNRVCQPEQVCLSRNRKTDISLYRVGAGSVRWPAHRWIHVQGTENDELDNVEVYIWCVSY